MRYYELRLAKLIEKGSRMEVWSQNLPLSVEVLAVIGHLGSLDEALQAFDERAKTYSYVGDQAADIVLVPLQLMETVVSLNRNGATPSSLVEMLRSGHLGRWPRNGSVRQIFISLRGTLPI